MSSPIDCLSLVTRSLHLPDLPMNSNVKNVSRDGSGETALEVRNASGGGHSVNEELLAALRMSLRKTKALLIEL